MMKAILIAAGLAAAAAPAGAQPNDLARFDVTQGANLAEKLVICDRAEQLVSGVPSRDATRAYVRVDGLRYDLALPPAFTRAGGWYDEQVEYAYYRLRDRGHVDSGQLRAARAKYRAPEFSGVDRISVAERRFLRGQVVACNAMLDELKRG
jgi:hypothetical protein